MAETTSQQSSRYSKQPLDNNRHCQYWDLKSGGCDAHGVTHFAYRMGGDSYRWWLCRKHYAKKRRQIYGCCSARWIDSDGKQHRCGSLRSTNTRGRSRKKLGYCRRHEAEFLSDAGERLVANALERVSALITIRPETGCWIIPEQSNWTTRRLFRCGGKQWTSYRLMFVHFFGGHENGLELAHDCHQRLCCNPLHLTPVRPRINRAAEHDLSLAVAWAVTSVLKTAPSELHQWADAHGLPLYGEETTRIVNAYLPSGDEALAACNADLESDTEQVA